MKFALTYNKLKTIITVLGLVIASYQQGLAEVSIVAQNRASPKQIIVKFRSELSRPIEDLLPENLRFDRPSQNESLIDLFDQHALRSVLDQHDFKAMRPLFEDLVRRKKQSGKSESQIFKEIKSKFAERTKRVIEKSQIPENISGTYALEFDDSIPTDRIHEIIAALEQNPQVAYAEQDGWIWAAMTPNDPMWSSSLADLNEYDLFHFRTTGKLGLVRENFEQAWDVTTGTGVVVAVTDTGLDCDHPDMAANCWTNDKEIPGNGIDDDGNGYIDDTWGWDFINNSNDPTDDNSHGTHVAGTIAAVGNNFLDVIGGAFGSKIMPVKVLNLSGIGQWSEVASGTNYACNNGADVINASLGGYGFTQAIADAVAACRSLGVTYVAAAMNDNVDCAASYPCSYSGVQCVASLDATDEKSSYSNFGNCIDVAAYGRDIVSLQAGGIPDYTNTVRWMSGTSMATPQVAALAALIISKNPSFSNDQVAQIIRTTADDIHDAGFDITSGYGRINAWQAVQVNSALEAIITAPLVANQLLARTDVTGKACGANFSSYVLDIGAGQNPISWTTLSSSSLQVCGAGTGGNLGSINVSSLVEGTAYTLRLTVTDTSGNQYVDRVGDLKFAILPTVTIISPLEGHTYGGATVLVSGTASDNIAVDRVEVQLDNDPYILVSGTDNWSYELTIPRDNYQVHIVRAKATDNFGNQQISIVTIIVDTRLPVISNVLADQIEATSARITWTTNKNADSQVEYGLTTAYGNTTTVAPALVTSHSQSITGPTVLVQLITPLPRRIRQTSPLLPFP
ncbi:MAG: S8 family serine peptidase [Deltaproteobacteria bacterium]|nr:S8 family serine peptidase [Deltaproteobacteria bacterium]